MYGQCLAVSNDPGITDGAGELGVVQTTHQGASQLLATAAAGIDASKLVLGQKRKNYSIKATATLIATVMGKLVSL